MQQPSKFFEILKFNNVPYHIIVKIFEHFENIQTTLIQSKFVKILNEDDKVAVWSQIIDSYLFYNSYVNSIIQFIPRYVQHEFNNFDLYIKEVLLCNCNSEVFFSTDTLTTKLVIEQSHAHTFVNVIKDIKEEMICI